jgi:hypothetical protein
MEESAYGGPESFTIWRRKDTHKDIPVTIEEKKLLMGEQATAAIGTELQLSRIDRP